MHEITYFVHNCTETETTKNTIRKTACSQSITNHDRFIDFFQDTREDVKKVAKFSSCNLSSY